MTGKAQIDFFSLLESGFAILPVLIIPSHALPSFATMSCNPVHRHQLRLYPFNTLLPSCSYITRKDNLDVMSMPWLHPDAFMAVGLCTRPLINTRPWKQPQLLIFPSSSSPAASAQFSADEPRWVPEPEWTESTATPYDLLL